jgi:hypothetical protein
MRFLKAGLLALAVTAPSFAEKAAEPAKAVVQEKSAPSKRIVAQQQAIKALPLADGEWRGPSRKKSKDGWVEMLQTQRVSTLLGGTVRVVESKGFEKSGELTYEAFAVISFDPDAKAYAMRSYSNGRVRDYLVTATDDSFGWKVEAGPDLAIRYENTLKNGVWTQTATRLPAKGEPETYLEFSLKRASGVTIEGKPVRAG